jgi:DNA-binding response OmpR family regulator
MKHVLIADDDGPLSIMLTERFRALGVEVTVAHDAAHALFLMQKRPPALVILDIQMPAGNGLAVCEMMRGDARLADLPVIIMSGNASDRHQVRARELSAHFVLKGENLWNQIRDLSAAPLGVAA